MPLWKLCVLFVALRVTQRFCEVSDVCLRLEAPFRPSATDFEGSKSAKSWLRFEKRRQKNARHLAWHQSLRSCHQNGSFMPGGSCMPAVMEAVLS
ncbi:hypothetical protein BTW15_00715 [Pseudomonas syringae pv. tomato]|uniref:Secreted protein n=1 Tax=Pseudomonas syringae pv. tomato TaxID=323 RepID=A0AB36KZA2_PSEUB|nr:hypothetical protein XJ28_11350 [Pseudomonas syringae pv. tomato]QBI64006.1 hypothetical protein EIZ61_22425 [Pseudomonas syringae]OPE61911.1 hypothetical protein BTW15_00715 [Pseudomonas syringae pv. tomato]TES61852.1 hypothetical protein E2N91_01005 [Pseudomonas syringae pv. tomato]TES69192.1 hypothetical protein E2N90_04655 [Pseudomonas syringae pv. tomato]